MTPPPPPARDGEAARNEPEGIQAAAEHLPFRESQADITPSAHTRSEDTDDMQPRERGLVQSLGAPLVRKLKQGRVLLVGAGGIGCELLQKLVASGFGTGKLPADASTELSTDLEALSLRKPEIVVIDLDTIDLSNLNRQFLFRAHHIKQPKALVAKETICDWAPWANIEAHHASIFDAQYDVDFFEGFDLVFNALDNLPARRHVNRMCLAANVTLIESGTTGFNGQVQVIKKGLTECYDCNEKPVQKSYPICTIRSTPSQPIHCIVWAKSYLLPELFGETEEDTEDVVVTEGDNAEEVAKLKQEAEALKSIRTLIGQKEFAPEVFNKVFSDDIDRLRSMSDMWKSRTPPTSLRFEKLCIDKNPAEQGGALAANVQDIWSVHDNLKVFCHSLEALSKRMKAQGGWETVIEFDKDDKDTLDLVASAANLRAHIFGIPMNSEWDIKSMAGNIIPAIATSNAQTAALCVLEAQKVLRNEMLVSSGTAQILAEGKNPPESVSRLGGAKMVFLTAKSTDRLVASEPLRPPKSTCPVCSPVYAKITVIAGDSPPHNKVKLKELVDLLKSRIGYDDFSITTGAGVIYDPDEEDNLDKTLQNFGIDGKTNDFLTVTDESDEPKVDLVLSVKYQTLDPSKLQLSPLDLIPRSPELPLKPIKALDDDEEKKRKREANDAAGAGKDEAKRAKTEEDAKKAKTEEDVMVIEDDGAILLD